jgi:hypothetical protein
MTTRSGSETRQRQHQVAVRLSPIERQKPSELAKRAGISSPDVLRGLGASMTRPRLLDLFGEVSA